MVHWSWLVGRKSFINEGAQVIVKVEIKKVQQKQKEYLVKCGSISSDATHPDSARDAMLFVQRRMEV